MRRLEKQNQGRAAAIQKLKKRFVSLTQKPPKEEQKNFIITCIKRLTQSNNNSKIIPRKLIGIKNETFVKRQIRTKSNV